MGGAGDTHRGVGSSTSQLLAPQLSSAAPLWSVAAMATSSSVAKEQMWPWVCLQPSGVHSCLVPTPELLLQQHHAWGDGGFFP